jgi:predicted MFS family arabinose efflux permease
VLAPVLRSRALLPLRDRSFRLLFAAQFSSLVGTGMAPIAIAFAVIQVHKSASAMSLVLAARMLPTVIFMLVGGVIADRLPRNRVMMSADLVSSLAQAATAATLFLGAANLWTLTAFQFIGGAAGALLMPAVSGLVPEIVKGPAVKEANALLGLSRNGARIGGAAVGGILVAAFGPAVAIAIDAASFLVSAILLRAVRIAEPAIRAARKAFVRELIEGWDEFRSRRWVWLISAQYAITNALGMGSFFVLGPLIADRSLGGATAWGLIMTANACGLIFGSAASLRISLERPLMAAPVGALFIVPVISFLALHEPAIVIAFAAFVLGFFAAVSGVFFETALQHHVPPDKLSRVAAYDIAASFAAIPLGVLVIGFAATHLGTSITLWTSATIVAVAGLVTLAAQDVRSIGSAPSIDWSAEAALLRDVDAPEQTTHGTPVKVPA